MEKIKEDFNIEISKSKSDYNEIFSKYSSKLMDFYDEMEVNKDGFNGKLKDYYLYKEEINKRNEYITLFEKLIKTLDERFTNN